jgi:hypothetical protein
MDPQIAPKVITEMIPDIRIETGSETVGLDLPLCHVPQSPTVVVNEILQMTTYLFRDSPRNFDFVKMLLNRP